MRKTKIVCTLGPATVGEGMLREMMLAGMNAARFNFSHGTHDEHRARLDAVKKLRGELHLPVAAMLDTKGPEVRLRSFEHGSVHLQAGQTFTLTTEDVVGDETRCAISYSELPPEVSTPMRLTAYSIERREEKNDPTFAKELADMAELYVSDAFGTVHRAHASTAGVAAYLPAVSGLLVAKELQIMGGALENPKRPFVAVLGGAKVSDKIGVINNLLDKADTIIIGGGMAYTFAKAQGGEIGKSLCESDKLDYALDMIEKAKKNGVKLLLPTDTLAATEFAPDAESRVVPTGAIPADMEGMDIGPDTTAAFCEAVKGAGTVVWNGPMGVFEFERFAQGTRAMAQALADSGAVTIVGGGDSAAAVEQMGFADKITHISTGGGASLEFLEGIELPGVACLLDK